MLDIGYWCWSVSNPNGWHYLINMKTVTSVYCKAGNPFMCLLCVSESNLYCCSVVCVCISHALAFALTFQLVRTCSNSRCKCKRIKGANAGKQFCLFKIALSHWSVQHQRSIIRGKHYIFKTKAHA